MYNIDLVTRLGYMIEQARKADNQELAKALGFLQLDLIEERQKEWQKGFNQGYMLGTQKAELTDALKVR